MRLVKFKPHDELELSLTGYGIRIGSSGVPWTEPHKDLVQMPTPMARLHPLDTPLADLRGKHWPEPMPPEPHRLMADVDAALVQKVLDVSQRQREPDIHHPPLGG